MSTQPGTMAVTQKTDSKNRRFETSNSVYNFIWIYEYNLRHKNVELVDNKLSFSALLSFCFQHDVFTVTVTYGHFIRLNSAHLSVRRTELQRQCPVFETNALIKL